MQEKMSANLLFLYGLSGSGKTRLLQMITETLREVQSVARVGSEQLVDEMGRSLSNQSFADFFDKYTRITNLLIDNLWILQSRPFAAKEMGSLIKARMNLGNLTVLASDLECQDVLRTLPAIGDCLQQKGALQLNMVQTDTEAHRGTERRQLH